MAWYLTSACVFFVAAVLVAFAGSDELPASAKSKRQISLATLIKSPISFQFGGVPSISVLLLTATSPTISYTEPPYANNQLHFIVFRFTDPVDQNAVTTIRFRFTRFSTEEFTDGVAAAYAKTDGLYVKFGPEFSGSQLPSGVFSTPFTTQTLVLSFSTNCQVTGTGFTVNVCVDQTGGPACVP